MLTSYPVASAANAEASRIITISNDRIELKSGLRVQSSNDRWGRRSRSRLERIGVAQAIEANVASARKCRLMLPPSGPGIELPAARDLTVVKRRPPARVVYRCGRPAAGAPPHTPGRRPVSSNALLGRSLP